MGGRTPASSLRHVLSLLVSHHVHRVWVVKPPPVHPLPSSLPPPPPTPPTPPTPPNNELPSNEAASHDDTATTIEAPEISPSPGKHPPNVPSSGPLPNVTSGPLSNDSDPLLIKRGGGKGESGNSSSGNTRGRAGDSSNSR
ncbi:unnamed protein product, partial [Closterium sp. NIES-54]